MIKIYTCWAEAVARKECQAKKEWGLVACTSCRVDKWIIEELQDWL